MNKNSHKPIWQRNGELWPMSVPTSMTWNDIGAVLMAIQEYCITTVIEIGVDQGGLAAMLMARMNYDQAYNYIGIELHQSKISEKILSMDIPIMIYDAFSEECLKFVQEAIQLDDNRVLILCDGGDKPREMKTYAPLLREGDIIMAHDYGEEIGWRDIPSDVAVLSKEWMLDTNLVLARKR